MHRIQTNLALKTLWPTNKLLKNFGFQLAASIEKLEELEKFCVASFPASF